MARPRKPDALSSAQRQQRYRQTHDLSTLKAPRALLARLDALARECGLGRMPALALLLDEWEANRRRDREGPPPVADAGGARRKASTARGQTASLPSGQQDLFGVANTDG